MNSHYKVIQIIALIILFSGEVFGDSSVIELQSKSSYELFDKARLYLSKGEESEFKQEEVDLKEWEKRLEATDKVSFLGGKYWLVFDVTNTEKNEKWVLAPRNTLIEYVDTYVFKLNHINEYASSHAGYYEPGKYPFHYGHEVNLEKGEHYRIAVRMDSRLFASEPSLTLFDKTLYGKHVVKNNVVILLCLGCLLGLVVYNLFVYIGVKDNIYIFYSIYMLSYMLAWSFQLNVFSSIFDFQWLEIHYAFFLLLPLSNAYFCIAFLKLDVNKSRIARFLLGIGYFSAGMIPVSFFAIEYVHIVATIAIASWEIMALTAGLIALKQGVKSARYFVAAFICLMIPSALVLPANIGLIPDLLENTELAVLVGGTFDGLFLAFAMADRLRILSEKNVELASTLERKVEQRTTELSEANKDLQLLALELREANKAKDRFFANMSHEIRTPLTSIIGYSDSLLNDEISEEQKVKAIESIGSSGKFLLQLINDILDLAKMEEDKLDVESIDVNLPLLLHSVETLFVPKAKKKGIEFKLDIQFPFVNYVVTDPTRLKQILVNLCGNAIKFTDKGSVIVEVNCKDNCLQVLVKDSGVGMTLEQQENLFKPFVQADTSIARRFGGTGLGLYLSQSLAHKLRGEITVRSAEGVGSSFTLAIEAPLSQNSKHLGDMSEYEQEVDKPIAKNVSVNSLSGQVLLAEDHKENNDLISLLLRGAGLEVVSVFNGKDAIREAKERSFSLILLDIQMPEVDGVQAVRKIRQFNQETPIIALTANVMSHEVEEYLRKGFDDHLAKPIDRKIFFDKVSSYIERARYKAKEKAERQSNIVEFPLKSNPVNEHERLSITRGGIVGKLLNLSQDLRINLEKNDLEASEQQIIKLKILADQEDLPKLLSICNIVLSVDSIRKIDKFYQVYDLLSLYCKFPGVDVSKSIMPNYIETIHESLISYIYRNHDLDELIHENITPKHYDVAIDMIHSIKGYSGNLGAVSLHENCLRLEELLRHREEDAVSDNKCNW